ncbi:MAG: hypothetical protein R6W86_14240 [Marinobacter sp.]|uniref:hypothetical protein n=1 Tax=Marinobacter sp. TaxID=50741 RepID=UPI00396E7104
MRQENVQESDDSLPEHSEGIRVGRELLAAGLIPWWPLRLVFSVLGALLMVRGFSLVFFVILLPITLASAMGCYLFFAQHSSRRDCRLLPVCTVA